MYLPACCSKLDLDRDRILGRRVHVYWRKEERLFEGTFTAWEAVPSDEASSQVSRLATANSRAKPNLKQLRTAAAGERDPSMTLDNCVVNIAYDDGDVYRKYLTCVAPLPNALRACACAGVDSWVLG